MKIKKQMVVEVNGVATLEPIIGAGRIMLTPAINEDYWTLRVRISPRQAVVVFPKFGVFGCGFALEEKDWNTNLPIACAVDKIYNHIKANRLGVKKEVCIQALRAIRAKAAELGLFDDAMAARPAK